MMGNLSSFFAGLRLASGGCLSDFREPTLWHPPSAAATDSPLSAKPLTELLEEAHPLLSPQHDAPPNRATHYSEHLPPRSHAKLDLL
jgi:hypothetical protein